MYVLLSGHIVNLSKILFLLVRKREEWIVGKQLQTLLCKIQLSLWRKRREGIHQGNSCPSPVL